MKALITGGAGFIGSSIARELASKGLDVVVLDNLSSGHRINISAQPGVRLVEKDVRDAAAIEAALMFDATNVDAIYGAMMQFFMDPALRESCSTKGLIKAKQYSS